MAHNALYELVAIIEGDPILSRPHFPRTGDVAAVAPHTRQVADLGRQRRHRLAVSAGPALVRDVARFVADLERFATVQTVASPRMLSLNNQPAFVQISSETGQEHSLIVTPQISADRVVVLGIVPRIDDRTGASPDAGTRQSVLASDSVVRVQPGETAVISAFPRSQGSADQHEILVLLTPSIVVPATGQEGRQ